MNDKTISHMQDLIRINIDSYKGFDQAADTIESNDIADLFRSIADNRRHHAEELRRIVTLTDEEAEDSGSIKGTVHRWWLSARGAVSGGDDHTVLSDAERGEDAIKHAYEDAIKDVDDLKAKELIVRQYGEIKAGHDKVRNLRDALAAQ